MMRSLFSGVAGLRAHQLGMDVIGDNIANVNTLGFKTARAHFSTALAQSIRGASPPTEGRGGTNPMEVGLGTSLGSIDTQFIQGNLESTGLMTDLAIEGDGLFILADGNREIYSRSGAFRFDRDGRLVDPMTGFYVRGFMADDTGVIQATGDPETIALPFTETAPARATSVVNLVGNLDADSNALGTILNSRVLQDALGGGTATAATLLTDLQSESGSPAGLVVGDVITINGTVGGAAVTPTTLTVLASHDLSDLATAIESAFSLPGGSVTVGGDGRIRISGQIGTANALSGVSITATNAGATVSRSTFNSLATTTESQAARDEGSHTLSKSVFDSLGFRHELALTFTKTATPGEWSWTAVVDGSASITGGGSGMVRFRNDGSLESFTYAGGVSEINIDPGNGAQPIALSINPGSPGDLEGLTQFSANSSASAISQDGYASGLLDAISIDQTGTINGVFSNGVTRAMAQVAVARFTNSAGLSRIGNNAFAATSNSGDPVVGGIGDAIPGRISPGTLEMSNVDLALEFTNMVISQRGFQANARIITVSDDMLSELVNLKR
jgi:flagellar hook protein FlgE